MEPILLQCLILRSAEICESSVRCSLFWIARQRDWTKLLIRSVRVKDKTSKGVRAMASETLEKYLAHIGGQIIESFKNLLNSAKVHRTICQPCTNILVQSGWFL